LSLEDGENRDEQADTDEYPAARPTEPDRRANLLALVFEAPGRDDERRLLGPSQDVSVGCLG